MQNMNAIDCNLNLFPKYHDIDDAELSHSLSRLYSTILFNPYISLLNKILFLLDRMNNFLIADPWRLLKKLKKKLRIK